MNYSSLLLPISLLLLLLFLSLSYLQSPPNPPKTSPSHLSTPPNPPKTSPLLAVPRHPLDPLTVSELDSVRSLLVSHPLFASSPSPLVFHSLSLDPPDKPAVLAWSPGLPLPPRRASAVVRSGPHSHSLSVDIATGDVVPLPNPASGYPAMTMEDMVSAAAAPLANPAFNRSVLARGVRTEDLACLPLSSGWFGREIEDRRRLIKVQCYSMEGTANFYMRPIEGLTVLVDMDTREVVEVTDKGAGIPMAAAAGTDYRYESDSGDKNERRLLKPISIEQPEGPSFEIVDDHR